MAGSTTNSQSTPSASNKSLSTLPSASSPTTPIKVTLPPNLAIFNATLPAPPIRSSIVLTLTTGTGASGEIRAACPDQ